MIPFLHGVFATNGGVASDFELIETQTVGAGGAASVTFSSIPGTYKHLQVRWLVRSTTSGTAQDEVQFRMGNGSVDSGSNYAYHFLYGNGTSAVSSNGTSQTYIRAGFAPRASATANAFGAGVVDILDYASTTKNKTLRSFAGADLNDTNGLSALCSGVWLSTAAVTLLYMKPEGSSSFPQYSTFSLYGVK